MGSIYQGLAAVKVSAILPGQQPTYVQELLAGTQSSTYSTLSTQTRQDVIVAIVSAMRYVWTVTLTAGALTVVLSIFLEASTHHSCLLAHC